MAKLLIGAPVADTLSRELEARVERLKAAGVHPTCDHTGGRPTSGHGL